MNEWLERAAAVVRAIDGVLPNERRSFAVGMQAVIVRWRFLDRLVVRADFAVQQGEVEDALDALVLAVGPKVEA